MSTRPLDDTRAFFAERAATWEERFPDDGPAYAAAVAELGVPVGGVALDLGCGTGRALVPLREAVGPAGAVVGLDATPEMLAVAAGYGRDQIAVMVAGDADALPFADASFDAVFAAGIIHHLPSPAAGLIGLARVVRAGGRLAIFHVISRAALAARHGHELRADDPLDPTNIDELLAGTGWRLVSIEDGERYLAIAERAQ